MNVEKGYGVRNLYTIKFPIAKLLERRRDRENVEENARQIEESGCVKR